MNLDDLGSLEALDTVIHDDGSPSLRLWTSKRTDPVVLTLSDRQRENLRHELATLSLELRGGR